MEAKEEVMNEFQELSVSFKDVQTVFCNGEAKLH